MGLLVFLKPLNYCFKIRCLGPPPVKKKRKRGKKEKRKKGKKEEKNNGEKKLEKKQMEYSNATERSEGAEKFWVSFFLTTFFTTHVLTCLLQGLYQVI